MKSNSPSPSTSLILALLALPNLLATLPLQADAASASVSPAKGPLTVLETNPRYFTDGSGRAVYLTGSHTWNNLSDMGMEDPPRTFDFAAYLDFLEQHGHNFIRLWRWELTRWDLASSSKHAPDGGILVVTPHPWKRTGPGLAHDGKPRFDLQRLDPAYFDRLRTRVEAAYQRGIYVGVMLFEGWALQHVEDSWQAHPFHRDNNVNGIDGDQNSDGRGIETHTLAVPEVTRLQEAYVRKVIDTVGDLDNVLYEIGNETGAYSTEWQYHMIRFIQDYQRTRPKQHPVGMTFQYSRDKPQRGTNKLLFDSPADWISPNSDAPDGYDYRSNPPVADGSKVVLSDTDHLWGIGGDAAWVWRSFFRGHNPIFMDPYDNRVLGTGSPAQWDALREALGQTRRLADLVRLEHLTPSEALSSTGYCLANPGREYLVYQPEAGRFTVDLREAKGRFTVQWLAIDAETVTQSPDVIGGKMHEFTPPSAGARILWLKVAD